MDATEQKAFSTIRRCVELDRYRVSVHFTEKMDERGLFWPDVMTILDQPTGVRSDGLDKWDRPKWIIAGQSTIGDELELVCVLDRDKHGHMTVFITIY